MITPAPLSVNAVQFGYPGIQKSTLRNINLALKPGEKIALMGASGSGKTTLAHLLVRFWDPDQGTIRIGGKDLKSFNEPTLRKTITLISQNAYLFAGSIRDNLRLANPRAGSKEMHAALEKAHLREFIDSLPQGLDTWIGEQGHLLSGGQARRLALSRAILHDAPIWILDEPTEGLDVNTEKTLMKAFLEAATERSLVLITHRPALIRAMDRVLYLESGRLRED